jgi:recombination protein RecT
MTTKNLPAKKPVDVLKNLVNSDSIQTRLKNAMDKEAGLFTLSLIDLFASDAGLQKCNPQAVVAEAMKAASLRLPITKSLGFAYIIPFKDKPEFVPGYKGIVQLCMRTGQFKILNADAIYEGEVVEHNRLTGEIQITGTRTGDNEIGYFAYMELTNGFNKVVYMTKDEVMAHAKKYSKSFKSKYSAWATDFGKMARKTPLLQLLRKWAPMSIEFVIQKEVDDVEPESTEPEVIDITPEPEKKKKKKEPADSSKTETTETKESETGQTDIDSEDPY